MKIQSVCPLWGPYSKKYMGLSRIVDDRAAEGARYDFVVHPTPVEFQVPRCPM